MTLVAVVDYGMCNLDSVKRAVEECQGRALVTARGQDLALVDRIILPGVGAFPDAMQNLKERGLDEALVEQVLVRQVPMLGICLGMQLLASRGHEGGDCEGLDLISGEVRRLEPAGEDQRIPHVGWNEVHQTRSCPLFRGIRPGQDFYFVHSYHFCPDDPATAVARTPYAGGFISALCQRHVFGVQFHPEKSQRAGFQLLRNFLAL